LKGGTLTNGLIKLSEVLVMRMRRRRGRGRGLDSSTQDMEKPPTELPQEIDRVSVLDPVVFSQNKNCSGFYSCKLTASAFLGESRQEVMSCKTGQRFCFFKGNQKKFITYVFNNVFVPNSEKRLNTYA
jgi:hypothetical protein